MGKQDEKTEDTLDKTVVRPESTVKTQVSRWDSSASVVIWLPTSRRGEQFILDRDVIVGRSKASDIFVDDSGMSKSHSKFSVKDDRIFIIDLDSTNGTFLDREKLAPKEPVELVSNCSLRMGSTVFMYYKPGSVEASKVSAVFKQAYMDPLTGTLNKRALLEKGPELVQQCIHSGTSLAMMMLDIDFFKKVNDEHPGGHLAGDYVLKELSALVQNQIIRVEDLFARFGGEEFVITLSGVTKEKSLEIAERLRKEVSSHRFSYAGVDIPLTLSIGLTMHRDKENLESILQRADQALYVAKQSGRNRCEFK